MEVYVIQIISQMVYCYVEFKISVFKFSVIFVYGDKNAVEKRVIW